MLPATDPQNLLIHLRTQKFSQKNKNSFTPLALHAKNTHSMSTTPPTEIQIKAIKLLLPLTAQERAKAACQHNCWEWPEALAEIKPEGFDSLTNMGRHTLPEFRQIEKVLSDMVSEFDYSQQWWVTECRETAEAHLNWWCSGKSRYPEHN
jgi:squalene cyclase